MSSGDNEQDAAAQAGREETVSRLWAEHMRAEFPVSARRVFAGVDLVMLDAGIAGCVDTWRSTRGSLDVPRRLAMQRLLHDLDRVLPLVSTPQDVAYFTRLRDLGRLVVSSWT